MYYTSHTLYIITLTVLALYYILTFHKKTRAVTDILQVMVKVKVAPLYATKALCLGRGIALPYLRARH